MAPRPVARWEVPAVAGLVLLGLALRVIFVLHMRANPLHEHPTLDAAYHVGWARAIAGGQEFADLAHRPFFRAPLYIWFLAGIFRMFGDELIVARLIQCGLGAITVGLVYWIGRRAFAPHVGLVAGLFAATYWVLIYFDAELLLETLAVPLDLLAIALTLRLWESARPSGFALAGLAWGVAAITRPNVLLFMPFAAGWMIWSQRPSWMRGFARAALFSVALLAPILPITAYNTWVKGDFVLISSQGGVNFWIGNNPDSDGSTAIVPGTRAGWWEGYYDSIALAEQAEGRPLRASEVSRHYASRAWDFILRQPGRSVPLLLEKLRLFWAAWEFANSEDVRFIAHHFSWVPRLSIGFAALAALGLLGLALSLREARLFPLWGFVPAYTISVVIFFVCSRFRLPVLPVLMIFAAHALAWLWLRSRARRWTSVVPALLFALAFGGWSAKQAPDRGLDANGYVNLGVGEARRGNNEQATQYLRRALEIEPNHVGALVQLAWGERVRGDPQSAAAFFQRALVLRPLRTDALEGLLDSLIGLGRNQEAEQWVARYFELLDQRGMRERPEIAYYHLGRARAARGDREGAREAFAEALRSDAGSVRAAVALGDLERDAGRWEAAIDSYQRAIARIGRAATWDSDHAYARLVEALEQRGRAAEACQRSSDWVARRPGSGGAQRARERACAAANQ